MIDRRQIQNIDWALVFYLLLNSILGVFIVYSGSHYLPGDYYLKQIIWIIISFLALVVFVSLDYKFLVTYSVYFYSLLIILLGWVLFFGKIVSGTKAWIKFPLFQVQPSELMKVGLILFLAYIFAEFRHPFLPWKKLWLSSISVLVPMILVSIQPDMGTALSYTPILLAAFILAGLNRKMVIIILVCVLLFGLAFWNLGLREYQKDRLTTLVFPGQDPLGAGYHIQQSKIAIGSGGFLGKGYRKGTQARSWVSWEF